MAKSSASIESLSIGDEPAPEWESRTDWRAALGRRASRARTAAGLTLSGVAQRSGLSPAYISQIESAHANPTVTTLIKVATALDVPIEELLGAPLDTRSPRGTFEARFTPVPLIALSPTGHGIWDLTAVGSTLLVTRLVRGPAGDHSQPVSHSGEEFLIVMAGCCQLVVGGLTRELNRFDSCHLASSVAHQIADVSDDLLLLVVLTEE